MAAPPLVLHAAAAFVVAGLWITGATLLAERAGSRVGGLVANLPSNVLVAMLFLALAHGDAFAAQAALALPVGMAIDTVFLLVMVVALPRGLGVALAAGFASWLALALLAQRWSSFDPWWGGALYVVTAVASFAVLEWGLRLRAAPARPRPVTRPQVLARASFAGSAVAGVVMVAGFAGPYFTGVLAVFPVVLGVTMTLLARNQGAAFAQATGKVMTLSSSNIVVFGLGIWIGFPAWGPWLGTAFAYALAAGWVLLLRPLLARAA